MEVVLRPTMVVKSSTNDGREMLQAGKAEEPKARGKSLHGRCTLSSDIPIVGDSPTASRMEMLQASKKEIPKGYEAGLSPKDGSGACTSYHS